MSDRPVGTVTYLFTDIEGSTGRWEEPTADIREALAGPDDMPPIQVGPGPVRSSACGDVKEQRNDAELA